MLEVVQFADNGRYGLRNSWTGIVVDKEWRTAKGARFALWRRQRSLKNSINEINKRKV